MIKVNVHYNTLSSCIHITDQLSPNSILNSRFINSKLPFTMNRQKLIVAPYGDYNYIDGVGQIVFK